MNKGWRASATKWQSAPRLAEAPLGKNMQLECVQVAAHARLRCRDVIKLLGISQSTLYVRLRSSPEFLRPVQYRGSNRWVMDEVLRYLVQQEASREA